jgi:hypothetical protein
MATNVSDKTKAEIRSNAIADAKKNDYCPPASSGIVDSWVFNDYSDDVKRRAYDEAHDAYKRGRK